MNFMNYDRCIYCNVTRAKAPYLKYYRFPKDEERCRKWVLACKLESLQSVPARVMYQKYRICSLHFRDADYASAKRVQLRSIACPSQFESSECSISLPDIQETLRRKLTNGSATGRPSKDPAHPDYIPSIFAFNKNAQNSKSSLNQNTKKTRKKILATESCTNPACENSSSDAGIFVPSSSGVKGFCSKCFSSESVSSAFSQSLEPLNQTLAQMMLKLTDMEEEREQLRNELALCRGEIHQLRESHQHCMRNPPSTSRTSTHSKPVSCVSVRSSTSVDETEILDSSFSDEPGDVYDSDVLPSQYLEQIYQQPDEASKGKRRLKRKLSEGTFSGDMISFLDQSPKKRVKSSSLESKSTSESSNDRKSSDTSSPITIVYLKR